MLDILLINGLYPDFEKGLILEGNIGIKSGKIDYMGRSEPEATEVIDVKGDIVSPGFIDIHMHEENFKEEGSHYCIANMMLKMGVTTAVGGNCGIQHQGLPLFKNAIKDLGGAPINYMMLSGYNQCRYTLGIDRHKEASLAEKSTIRDMISKELEEGACGISFGIEYDPGITTDEVLYAVGADKRKEDIVAAHYRGDNDIAIASIKEMMEVGEAIPQKFQISHLSSCSAMGQMSEALELIHKGMIKNPRLNYDTYPYNAFSTTMGSEVFVDGCLEKWHKNYSDIMLTEEPYLNQRCTKSSFEDARLNYPEMLAVAFVMNEDEIAEAVADKYGMIASDGIINNGNGHPRAAGTFPRVLGKYVREEKVISLYDALRKMTKEPADRLCIFNKGRIALGCDADLTIFNKDKIIDGATYEETDKGPKGIDYVIVDGEIAIKGSNIINDRLGEFINFNKVVD